MPDHVLEGVIPALLTPLSPDGSTVDERALEHYVDALVAGGVTGLFAGGTMGEGPLLSVGERMQLAEATLAAARGRIPVVVHVGAITTGAAVELAMHAAESGAQAVAAVPPYYYPLTHREVAAYFEAIHEAAPGLALYAYNLPSYSRNALTPEFLVELKRDLPALAGVKESSGDRSVLDAFLAVARAGLDVICGADHLVLHALLHGAVGSVSSGAAVFPSLYRRLTDAARAQDPSAERLQHAVDDMQAAMSRGQRLARYKRVWSFRGIDLGPVRPPLSDVEAEELRELRAALDALGLPISPGALSS